MSVTFVRQRRATGQARKTENIRVRIDAATADRLDMALLRVGESLSEFVRVAVADRIERLETRRDQAS